MTRRKLFGFEKRWAAGSVAATLILAGVLPTMVASKAEATSSCTAVNVVVARGTDEPGQLGALVGDRVYSALQRALPLSTSAYRVNYPATLVEPASVDQGSVDLIGHLTRQAAVCPGQQFILVGYSQGAYVVDSVLGQGLPVDVPPRVPGWIAPRVAAVLLFGNPIRDIGWRIAGPFGSRTDDFCASGDPICQLGGLDPAAHVSYGFDVAAAVAFAADHV